MKKSEMYHAMQRMLLAERELTFEAKLEILRELFAQEDLAKYREEQEEQE
jgi:hypothetical protein